MRALGASDILSRTTKKRPSTVIDLLQDGSKGCNDHVKEGDEVDTEEAVATAEPGLAMDGWEQQTCEAPTSPVLARTSNSSSWEASGARRRRSSILRPRSISSDSL
jgi:hypothetical protein